MAKKINSPSLLVDLGKLPKGFHHRRVARDGVGFEAFIWRGAPGPVLLVNGATHGDEYEGPTLLQQWVQRWKPRGLRGTVVFVPVLNEVAFFAGARCRPDDGANLARSFPGKRRGNPTQRLACLFDEQLLAQCTHYVDFHSGGGANALKPWVGYVTGQPKPVDRTQRKMAACFDQFWCWSGPFLPGRTLSAAAIRKIPAIYTECRGAGDVTDADLAALDLGLRRMLIVLGLLKGRVPRLRPQVTRITRSVSETHLQVHHQAPHDGLFMLRVKLDERLRRGAVLGEVVSLTGKSSEIRAEHAGRVVVVRLQRSVRQGDALAVLAPI
ncbi:MAG: M14 family metallopeptidase [Opitutaceae bacterium]